MTYTAEQLRGYANSAGSVWYAPILLAFADALEENARLTRECEFHAKQCARVDELRHRAEAELAKLRQHAEAMAEHWEKDDTMNMMQSAVDAYRRDYPEGTK